MEATLNRKETILQEGARLFREKGYRASSMRDLAQLVGIEVSSLYNHIRSKEEILQSICFQVANDFLRGLAEIEAQVPAHPVRQLRSMIRLHVRIALGEPTSVTVFNDEWRNLSEPHLARFLAMRKDYEHRFLDILKKGMKSGCFRSMNPHTALYTILSSLRWLHGRIPSDEKYGHMQRLEEEMISLLTSGLVADEDCRISD